MEQMLPNTENINNTLSTKLQTTPNNISLINKIFRSFLVAVLVTFIFILLYYFGFNTVYKVGRYSFYFIATILDPRFILLAAIVSTPVELISAFGGKLLLFSSKPKRIYPFMMITPIVLLLGFSGFWFWLTPKAAEGGLVTMTFAIISLIPIIPILLFNSLTAKILYLYNLEREKSKPWLLITGYLLLFSFAFVTTVNVSGWLRTKDIEVTKEEKIGFSEKLKSREISKEEFDSIASPSASLITEKTPYNEVTQKNIYKTTVPGVGELVEEDDQAYALSAKPPEPQFKSKITYRDFNTGVTKIISDSACSGVVLFSPKYLRIILSEPLPESERSIFEPCELFLYNLKTDDKIEIDSKVKYPLVLVDSNTILYEESQEGKDFEADLWIYDILRKERKQITKNINIDLPIYASQASERFILSSDSAKVAFSTKEGLFIANLGGTGAVQIATQICTKFDPSDPKYYGPKGLFPKGVRIKVTMGAACREIKWPENTKIYFHKFNLDEDTANGELRESLDGYWEITLQDL